MGGMQVVVVVYLMVDRPGVVVVVVVVVVVKEEVHVLLMSACAHVHVQSPALFPPKLSLAPTPGQTCDPPLPVRGVMFGRDHAASLVETRVRTIRVQ